MPAANPNYRDLVRWARFCKIFSGRDGRFAITNWNTPGGGLERYLLVDFNGCDEDDESWSDGVRYQWPLNLEDPADRPRFMRLLFLFQDATSDAFLLPLAEAIVEQEEDHGQSWMDSTSVVDSFRDVLCRNTEILLGLPDNMLRDLTEPQCDYVDLLLRVRMKELPTEGETSIALIGKQPGRPIDTDRG